jgi:hypothetical protein
LHNDVPALQHLHAEVARAQEAVARKKAELAQLVSKIHETLAEQRPCLVAHIQSLVAHIQSLVEQIGQDNSWGHACQTFAQWRLEAIVRCLAPHAEAGAMAKAYRHFSETQGWVAGGITSGKNRQDRDRSRNEQIYQEYTQDRPTGQRAMAAKKDALARKFGLKTRRQVGRILAEETARKAGEPPQVSP